MSACSRKRLRMEVGIVGRLAVAAAVTLWPLPEAEICGQLGPQIKHEPQGPWENRSLAADERADLVIQQMTLDEKIQLLHGLGWESMFTLPESGPSVRALQPGGFIPGVPRLGIPDLPMSSAAAGGPAAPRTNSSA